MVSAGALRMPVALAKKLPYFGGFQDRLAKIGSTSGNPDKERHG